MARNPFALVAGVVRGAPQGLTTAQLLPAYLNKVPQFHEWDTQRAIREGYKASVWVYACVRRIADAAKSVPWYAYERDSDGGWNIDNAHPLSDLLANPNPYMTGSDMIERAVAHLLLGGNGLLSKILLRGRIVELWPIDPSLTMVIPSREDFIASYRYNRGGEWLDLDPETVVHIMLQDPANPYWGMGPLQAAARAVDTDVEAVRWNKVALQNRAVTDGVFSADQVITQEQWSEMRAQVREQYSGADNARTPWVLGGGVKWNRMALSPIEMDFLESRKLTREEIAGVFNVPLPILGAYEHATLANIETARQIFWGDTIVPLLNVVADALSRALVPHFGDLKSLAVKPDLSEVKALREDFAAKADTFKTLVSSGVPVNMAAERLEMDLDDIPGGDIGLVPVTMIPLTTAGESSGDHQTTVPDNAGPMAGKSLAAAPPAETSSLRAGLVTLTAKVEELARLVTAEKATPVPAPAPQPIIVTPPAAPGSFRLVKNDDGSHTITSTVRE